MKKILFLWANPINTPHLNIRKELDEIAEIFSSPNDRRKYHFQVKHLVTREEFINLIVDQEPYILHFSGHGSSGINGLIIETAKGKMATISLQGLTSFFKDLKEFTKDKLHCVIFNSCQSEKQMDAITQFIPVVIGTTAKVKDEHAIIFSKGFYKGLIKSESVESAFKLGVSSLGIYNEFVNRNKIPFIIKTQQSQIMENQVLSKKKNESPEEELLEVQIKKQPIQEELERTSEFQELASWLNFSKDSLSLNATNRVLGKEEKKGDDFRIELIHYLELLHGCLLTERNHLLHEPIVEISFPVEKYKEALQYISTRIPAREFNKAATEFLKNQVSYLIERI